MADGTGTPMSAAERQTALSWDILKELSASERHFNALEAEYRKLASVWLLAGFAGIGFILQTNPTMAIPQELAIAGIGLAASVGIYLLWIVDLLVYHRLLDACFTEAKKIEARHAELPQVRSSMGRSLRGGRVVTTRLRWFYILLTAAPIAFAAPIFVLWCAREWGASSAVLAAAATLLYLGLTSLMIWRKSVAFPAVGPGTEDMVKDAL